MFLINCAYYPKETLVDNFVRSICICFVFLILYSVVLYVCNTCLHNA